MGAQKWQPSYKSVDVCDTIVTTTQSMVLHQFHGLFFLLSLALGYTCWTQNFAPSLSAGCKDPTAIRCLHACAKS